jgi:hypothetical protein
MGDLTLQGPEGLRKHTVSGLVRLLPNVGLHGRLAGFTNQQLGPNREGWQRFVLARGATGKVAPAAATHLAAIERHLRESAAEKQRLIVAEKARKAPQHDRARLR